MSSYVIRILSNRSIISDTSIGSFHQPLSSAESVVRCGDISDIRSGNGRENKDNNQPTASSQSQGGKYFTSGGFCDRLHSTTCTLIFELCCGCKPSQLLEGVWKRFQWISESDLTKGKYLGNIFSLHSKYIFYHRFWREVSWWPSWSVWSGSRATVRSSGRSRSQPPPSSWRIQTRSPWTSGSGGLALHGSPWNVNLS